MCWVNSAEKLLMREQQGKSFFGNINVLDTLLLLCVYVHYILQYGSQHRSIIKLIKLLSSGAISYILMFSFPWQGCQGRLVNTLKTYGNSYIPFYKSASVLIELIFQFIEIILAPNCPHLTKLREKKIKWKQNLS